MCKRVMMDPEIKPGKDVCGDIQEDMKAQRKEDGSNGFQVPVGPKDFWSQGLERMNSWPGPTVLSMFSLKECCLES